LQDNAGTSPTEKIFTDWEADPGSPKVGKVPNSPQDNKVPLFPISSLPASAPHRNVDLMIVRADAAGFVHAYIVLPSTIYGISKTVFADRGLANPQSQQVPLLIRMSIDRGAAAMVGKGANVWPNVHIRDCAVSTQYS
jgi:hypothetical protein